jgi:error-prone DNA polymerase
MSETYAELVAASNFSFLRGASHPDEMVLAAKALGLAAIGLCDRNSLAGVVRAHKAAKKAGMTLCIGTRLVTRCGFELATYPRDRAAYARLSRLLTLGKRRTVKGKCDLGLKDVLDHAEGQVFILLPPADPGPDWQDTARHFCAAAPDGACHLALAQRFDGQDGARVFRLTGFAGQIGLPLIATTDALYHTPERRALQDALTCIREKTTIDTAGFRLEAHAERHLKPPAEMARLFAAHPEAVANTMHLARRLRFSLDEIAYQYPDEIMEPGETAMQTLTRLSREKAVWRYPDGIPDKVAAAIEYELTLIRQLDYAPYFLTVYDIVRHARSRGILCQGRGSAANSTICYCLGITSVDPARIDLLFERFVSAERNEPPDIDVDFEHERREEVIQYIYGKYGRHRAGMTATVTTYRSKGAIRDIGKAMGLSPDLIDALARAVWHGASAGVPEADIRAMALDPDEQRLALAMRLVRELIGFPRHLSQHPGGFVITRDRLDDIVPVMNAAMADRTMIEWDKDDIETLGLMKVDVLGLGMLSVIAKALALLREAYGRRESLASLQDEDPRVYDMICEADTVGVFQIESRAQMSMLPRLKPRQFYDLVIEVAIVRPGPIQGDMVHPYLRRREGRERIDYPSPELKAVLGRTLGVPLFQEQAMKIAVVAAGFTPAEADGLRRAMATFRHAGIIHEFRHRFLEGMIKNGYAPEFAERCFKQIEGFGEYGFPESHAASFALLVYVSAWLKCHYPDVFCTAILNAQPMGFYAAAQLVRDAREHGVDIRPPDINHSAWDCTLEAGSEPGPDVRPNRKGAHQYAVRLGLRQVKGLAEAAAARIVAARQAGGNFICVESLMRRAALSRRALDQLANADAMRSLGQDRRAASWQAAGLATSALPLFAAGEGAETANGETPPPLPDMPASEQVYRDYRSLGLSLKGHPLGFFRQALSERGLVEARALKTLPNGSQIDLAGLVLIRQRPGSASGIVFVTLEDETGVANLIVWGKVFERFRRTVIGARLLRVKGRLQREGRVIHIIAETLIDESWRIDSLQDDGDGWNDRSLLHGDDFRAGTEADPRPLGHNRQADTAARHAGALQRSRDFH